MKNPEKFSFQDFRVISIIDGGKTWIDHPDKSKLTFTNVKIDGVVKGEHFL